MIALSLALALVAGDYAPARQGLEPLDAQREARVMKLGKVLRCAVCQGLSIADSPASMARAQLDKVRELVAEGKTDQEVMDYFVARYGEWALLEPTTNGLNGLLWLGPVVLLVVGLLVIVSLVKKRAPGELAPQAPAAAADDPFLAQVRAELEK
ncbi:MAG: cytochrome c-type biogenesis protein CcmH [Myxococcaceae bacterium]|nr:cytochrome c-type biogenesis protein CcmH [Myxococcaceae bacterium]